MTVDETAERLPDVPLGHGRPGRAERLRATLRSPAFPTVAVFLVFIFGFTVANVLVEDREVSVQERRTLTVRPELSLPNLLNGQFTKDVGAYMTDQAAGRDQLRFLKSAVSRHGFQTLENNETYAVDGRAVDKLWPLRGDLVATDARKMNEIIDSVGSDPAYLAIIPTKGAGVPAPPYLEVDQDHIADQLRDAVAAEYVDLMDLAQPGNEGSYYGTDPHWTTDGALEAYRRLAIGMGFEPSADYSLEVLTTDFVGSQYGRAAAWEIPLDTIELAHNPVIDGLSMCRLETLDRQICQDGVYVMPTAATVDGYDVFLGGLAPLIEIQNPAVPDGHLIVFKDSFAHAIAPFLAQHVRTVSLVDLRFVQRSWVLDNVDFEGATVLFLYGAAVINTDPKIIN